MVRNKSSISKAGTNRKIGDYWDKHDLSEHWDDGKDVDFEIDISSEITYCTLDRELSEKVQKVAKEHGVSSDTLVNMWIQERLNERTTV